MSLKVGILVGSVRTGRQSVKVARYLRQKLGERNIATDLIDLAENTLPVFGTEGEDDRVVVDGLSKRLHNAEAFIFVTPEYHGSFSGVLKNTLDYFWPEFQHKPVGVAAASAGKFGGINASTQLQHLILSLGAYPLPVKFLVPDVRNSFTETSVPVADSIIWAANRFLDKFIWFSEAICRKTHEQPIA